MKKGLDNCDIVMMLRLQNERMQGSFLPSAREYYEFFGLTPDKLKMAKKNKKKSNVYSFQSKETKIERQIEAILFAASEPLDVETIESRIKTNSDIS